MRVINSHPIYDLSDAIFVGSTFLSVHIYGRVILFYLVCHVKTLEHN